MNKLRNKLVQPLCQLTLEELEYLLSDTREYAEVRVLWVEKIVRFLSSKRRKASTYIARHYGQKKQVVFRGFHQLLIWYALSEHTQNIIDHRIVNALCWLEEAHSFTKDERYLTNELISKLLQQQSSYHKKVEPNSVQEEVLKRELLSVRPAEWNKKVIIFSPQTQSLYTLCVLIMCAEMKIPVAGVVVRKMSVKRAMYEASQFGFRPFLAKVWSKLFRDKFYSDSKVSTLKECADILKLSHFDVAAVCKDMKIPCLKVGEFEEASGFLREQRAEIGAFTGGGLISKKILEMFSVGVINVHMGILPKYKGMGIVEAAILENNTRDVGLTSHVMDVGIDTGPIINTLSLPLNEKLSINQIYDSLSALTPAMTMDAIFRLSAGEKPASQAPSGRQYYTLHPRLKPCVDIALDSFDLAVTGCDLQEIMQLFATPRQVEKA